MASILDWVRSHPALDAALAAAGIAVAAALLVAAVCGTLYLALTLRRLSSDRHVRAFVSRPIGSLRRARLFGQEFAFHDHVLTTDDTIRRVRERLDTLERVVGDLTERLHHGSSKTEEPGPKQELGGDLRGS